MDQPEPPSEVGDESPSSPEETPFQWVATYDYVIAGYTAATLVIAQVYGLTIDYPLLLNFNYDVFFLCLVAFFIVMLFPMVALQQWMEGHDDRPFGEASRKVMAEKYFSRQKLYDLVHILFLMKVLLVQYSCLKQAIPLINPWVYDDGLLLWDLWLHYGFNPMTGSVQFLGTSPEMVEFMDSAYLGWYAIQAPTLVIFAFLIHHRPLHIAFFSAYFCLWVFSGLITLILPSLGPIYISPEWFPHIDGTFADQLQSQLWGHYLAGLINPEQYQANIYEGIAAFPSLHVGVIALFSFFLYPIHRGMGLAMGIFTAVTLVGSVYLGWHYAVDGYFTILLSYVLYRLWMWNVPPIDKDEVL